MKRPRRTSTERMGDAKATNKANNDDTTTSLNLLSAENIQLNNFTSKSIDGSGDFHGNFSEMGFQVDIHTLLRR